MAIGLLLSLKKANTIEEAEKAVKSVRPQIEIHPTFKQDLKELFPDS